MDLILEDEDGEQYNVIIGIEDYLDDPKTIMKEIKLAIEHAERESEG